MQLSHRHTLKAGAGTKTYCKTGKPEIQMTRTTPAAHLAWLHEPRSKPLCVAHRGASEYGFDNSQEALERAALIGADLFKVNVRTSADGVLFVLHDPTVRQLAG